MHERHVITSQKPIHPGLQSRQRDVQSISQGCVVLMNGDRNREREWNAASIHGR